MKIGLFLACLAVTCGCQKKYPMQTFDLVVDKACVSEVAVGGNFECRGKNETALVCTGLRVTYRPECAKFQVKAKK